MKRSSPLALVILLAAVFCTSCVREAQEPRISKKNVPPPSEIQEAFLENTLVCETADCPDAVASLNVLMTPSQFPFVCSATLIGNRQILTNAHCVPQDLRQNGASCAGRVKINFPANRNFPPEQFDCESVQAVHLGPEFMAPFRQDWAILTLRGTTNRQAARSSQRGVARHSMIQLFKVDRDLFSGDSVVTETRCQANTSSSPVTQDTQRWSNLVEINDCDANLIVGNSGAGYFNEQGRLVGVHSWGCNPGTQLCDEILRENPLAKPNFGGGTNISCIEWRTDRPAQSRCH